MHGDLNAPDQQPVKGAGRVFVASAYISCVLFLALVWVGLLIATDTRDRPVNEPTNQRTEQAPPVELRLIACPSEDSGRYCYWDASQRGNGAGASFWRDGSGTLHWLPTNPEPASTNETGRWV